MNNYYRPSKFTEEYINLKNIIKLCLNKKIYDNNILNNILKYVNKYDTGFALFDDIFYKTLSNKKLHYNNGGHPFELILRIFCELKDVINILKCDTNLFNKFIKYISNIPNYNKININECLLYINDKYPKIIENYLDQPTSFTELLNVIDKKIYNYKIKKLTSTYKKKIVCNNCNSIIFIHGIPTNDIYPLCGSLLDQIKKESNFFEYNNRKCGECRSNDIYYKQVIKCNKIIHFEIRRLSFNEKWQCGILTYSFDFPKILKLPFFVCENNKQTIYNLKFIICYIDNKFSIIIKKDNKSLWYHYYKDYILEVAFDYILENSKYITSLIYILNDQ